uniref:Glycerophosphodiester phosphodiesterase domain-containing protein 1-like n=1 Tax=Sinocyclocheilus rhinocerous TaxID=307959 RepID=A0A673NGD7_9TELE
LSSTFNTTTEVPLIGGYALTSLYFLKNPHILLKKKQTAFYCTHISHRGGTVSESITSSCLGAAEVGTEMLELDCHLTKDGHVVVSHDENLLRQTGQDVNISSLNLEELPPYNETLEVTFKTGVCHFSTGSDRNFALLEDVFRKFPHIAVNIEVKENNSMLIERISDLVKEYNREATSVWASVDTTIMKNCRKTTARLFNSKVTNLSSIIRLYFYLTFYP